MKISRILESKELVEGRGKKKTADEFLQTNNNKQNSLSSRENMNSNECNDTSYYRKSCTRKRRVVGKKVHSRNSPISRVTLLTSDRPHQSELGLKTQIKMRKENKFFFPAKMCQKFLNWNAVMWMLVLTAAVTAAVPQLPNESTLFRPSRPDPTCVCDPLCEVVPDTCVARVARKDCPCCTTCAVSQEGASCDQVTRPCDVTKKLMCDEKENVCKASSDLVTCSFEEKVYHVGEKYSSSDCDLKCECRKNGSTSCAPMKCRRGLHKKGSFASDPYCLERATADIHDKCCVLVICSDVEEEESNDEPEDESDGEFKREGEIGEEDKSGLQERETQTTPSATAGGKFSFPDDDEEELQQEEVHVQSSAAANIEFLQITPNSIQIQFPGITGGNLMYVEENKKTPAGKEIPWQNALILEGNKIFTLGGLKAGVRYRLRWQAPDKQYPDITVSTRAFEEKPPRIILTKTSFDSVTVSFDHFAPNSYKHGYVAMYKPVFIDGIWKSQEDESEHSSNNHEEDLPSITIKGLRPNTKYMVRVGIYEDYSTRSFGKTTSIIEVETDVGCFQLDKAYPVGEFNIGCENSCECYSNGIVECGPRCQKPFHISGSFSDDPLCVEQYVDGDDCCVLITCAGNADIDEEGPCTSIQCGPNAECRHEVFRGEDAGTICVCKDGFTGDPDDSAIGCVGPTPVTSGVNADNKNGTLVCQVKNETYAVGAEWFDGCEYKCACSEKLEILCQPRCKIPPPEEDRVERCEFRPDPDDSCCKVMYCPDPAGETDGLKPVGLPFHGCVFKNESYDQGQRFYDGCESQCQCMGYGDMVCLSRCPPTAPPPGQNCYTLPDASDPCCNITVCDKPVLDEDQNVPKEEVMKKEEEEEDIEGRIVNKPPFGPPIPGTERFGIKIGEIETLQHGVSGVVYALNESTLFIKDLKYDGRGPDAFFYVGSIGEEPSHKDGIILPYPFEGKFYDDYNSDNIPVLGPFIGEDVVLNLPKELKVENVKWFSVWCRKFSVDFGHLIWPEKISSTEDSESPKVEPKQPQSTDTDDEVEASAGGCVYKSEVHPANSDFHDGCENFCHCDGESRVECHPIGCPSSFGLDVINPFCLDWDKHDDFEPVTPMCCPPLPVCLNDGMCHYKGHKFNNYENIAANLSGCESRCYCENGEVLCQDACYELPEQAPGYLSCAKDVAIKVPQEERPCCLSWACPEFPELPKKLEVLRSEPLNATSVKFHIRVPRALDGIPGYFEVFYTSGLSSHPDPDSWPTKIVTTENGKLIVNSENEAELILAELLPNQQYFLKINVHVKMGEEEAVVKGDIMSARTLPPPETTLPPVRLMEIDLQLAATNVNFTSVFVSWRPFSASERTYVDGIQIRYVEVSNGVPTSGVPGTSPFIHRDTNFYMLHNLNPDTEYMLDIYIIPVPRSSVELVSEKRVTFKTLPPAQDPFDISLIVEPTEIASNGVELTWKGVPRPEEKFVSLYKINYAEYHVNAVDDSKVIYREAKIDTPNFFRIQNLSPKTRYEVWLETFMRNGKIIKSNVLDVETKNDSSSFGPAVAAPSNQEHGEAEAESENNSNNNNGYYDYYNSMVAAAIIAAFAILALIIVTALYLRRTTTYKAIISGQAVSSPRGPFKNGATSLGSPSANVENGNGSMEMNGRKS